MRGVHARHHAGSCRGRYGTGVGVGHHDARAGQSFHIGRMESEVVGVGLFAEGERGLRPAEIVHQEEDDVRALAGVRALRHCERGECRQTAYSFVDRFHVKRFSWYGKNNIIFRLRKLFRLNFNIFYSNYRYLKRFINVRELDKRKFRPG